MRHIPLRVSCAAILAGCVVATQPGGAVEAQPSAAPAHAPNFEEPLFDFKAILNDPLDAKVLSKEEVEGVVYEEVEYTAEVLDGKPVRIYGILAYPKGGRSLPAVYWSQSGMYGANRGTPGLFAKKGYCSMVVTLPHDVYKSFTAWNASDPKAGNLTHLAYVQMRGITYMTTRLEVDPDRIGVSGSSYGGFFATLLAGADPRIRAGCSFFAAGNSHLGTHRPQFTQLNTREDVAVWLRTIDPAWRLRYKAVPFMWVAAGNDNWEFLPSIRQTYLDAAGDKRLAIIPGWMHGLPEPVDQQLWDYFDVYLTKTRKPYNRAGPLEFRVADGRLTGRWGWTGENRVAKAELVYSYGPFNSFGFWVHRLQQPVGADIQGATASAAIPVPDPDTPILVYGNITDENGVVISTVPETVVPAWLGIGKPTGAPSMNGIPYGDFEADDIVFLQRQGFPVGAADRAEHRTGAQSVRMDPPADPAKEAPEISLKLFNVMGVPHRLSFWMKAGASATVFLKVVASPPQDWDTPMVRVLMPEAAALYRERKEIPSMIAAQSEIKADTEWRQFTLDVPVPAQPIEGYDLILRQIGQAKSKLWMDTFALTPLWGGSGER